MAPTEGEAAAAEEVMARAAASLAQLCAQHGIDESHGVAHAKCVLAHAERAVSSAHTPLLPSRVLALRLAALLHDADDHKYFGRASAKEMANASRIMRDALEGARSFEGERAAIVTDACLMISLVSCSANGNSCPPRARDEPELLWPRWADRLEAAGEIGVARCYMHNQRESVTPLAVDGVTPKPTTEAEAWAFATEERFADYQARGGSSASMLDHFYDKLLQVARPPPSLVRNAYLEAEAAHRAAPLLRVCLHYGRTGEVAVDEIEAIMDKLGLRAAGAKQSSAKQPRQEEEEEEEASLHAKTMPKTGKKACLALGVATNLEDARASTAPVEQSR